MDNREKVTIRQEIIDTTRAIQSEPANFGKPEAIALGIGTLGGIIAVSAAINPYEAALSNNNLAVNKHKQDIATLELVKEGSIIPNVTDDIEAQADNQIYQKQLAIREIKAGAPEHPNVAETGGLFVAPIAVALLTAHATNRIINARKRVKITRREQARRRGID